MKLEAIINEIQDLKRHFEKGATLKNYCEYKKLSYTSTSRILKKGVYEMKLRTAFNILGLTPERNMSQVVLETKIKDLIQIKKYFVEHK